MNKSNTQVVPIQAASVPFLYWFLIVLLIILIVCQIFVGLGGIWTIIFYAAEWGLTVWIAGGLMNKMAELQPENYKGWHGKILVETKT
jgi:hypothetical protein